jgi:hypothetical protein
MSIKVECPGCLKTIKAPDHYAGKVAKCPGCGNSIRIPEVSETAVKKMSAPPLPQPVVSPASPLFTAKPDSGRGDVSKENELMTVRPSTFRTRPFAYSFVVLLILVFLLVAIVSPEFSTGEKVPGLWFVPLLLVGILVKWHIEALTTSLSITSKRSILRNGLLSKRTREVRHSDVRLLEVEQSLGQRIFGVGRVSIASSAHGAIEIVMDGITHPEHVKETIDGYR